MRYRTNFSNGVPSVDLPNGDFSDVPMPLPPESPKFPDLPNKPILACFCDASYANIKPRRKSTTGYCIFLAGAAVVYQSKTQTQTALSSTKAEFYAVVSAAKIVRYLRFILHDLNFPKKNPTITYEDNQSTKKIIDAVAPTERSRHIAIPHFAMSDWKADGSIEMSCIAGKLNPADVLTKPFTWVLHDQHARRIMGHFSGIHHSTDLDNLQSSNSRLGEGISRDNALNSPNPSPDVCHL